jgi:tetratricopeptide (TPR) repeat protein
MPTLKQLEEFKTSFLDIGNEAVVLAKQNIPRDELPLPDSEPLVPPAAPAAGEDAALGDEDFNFGDFLDTIPDDLSVPVSDLPDIPDLPDDAFFSDLGPAFEEGDSPPDAGLPGAIPPGTEENDFQNPDALLADLEDAIEAVPAGSADSPPETGLLADSPPDSGLGEDLSPDISVEENASPPEDVPAADDFENFGDLGDFEDFTQEEFSPVEDASPESSSENDPFALFSEDIPSLSGDDAPEDFSSGDISEDLLSDTWPSAEEPTNPQTEAERAGEDLSALIPDGEAGNIDIPGMDPGPRDVSETEAPDTFENFTLDLETPQADFAADGEKSPENGSGGFSELEEFALAGIDDVFNKTAPAETAAAPGKGVAAEVEEIRLNDRDVSRLQETLSSYPLNLRIACEELIAENTIPPAQMSSLIKLLVKGAPPRETASLAGKILDRSIPIPRGFEKRTGEALEIEQAGFPYIFVHKFLPVLRLVAFIVLSVLSLFYLGYRFIYTPIRADSIYQAGYERIEAGEFARANDRFTEAFALHRVKQWFYRYAEAFRDNRQYIYAEEKYDDLLRQYPRDKKGVLDYAALETDYLKNYSKADTLIRRNILDYAVDDREALLALGDTNLAWGEIDHSRYEEARQAYARLLERYGWQDPIVERMLRYFIRIDNLGEVVSLQDYILNPSRKRKISPPALAELGGYLLDKRFEEVRGVPNEYIDRIDGIRNILLRAVTEDPSLPESHYHLARYYSRYGYTADERQTLERAVRAFDAAPEESVKRIKYRLDALRRYAQVLINAREFFSAEEQITRGINLYEDGISRRLFSPSPEFGRLYADLGDLEYFTKDGNMEAAIQYYRRSERNGWAPPEIQYRMGSAYYHLRQWEPALERFFNTSVAMPLNRRLLHSLGNASYMRGDFYAAQGYYDRLLDILDKDRARFTLAAANDSAGELAERLMVARNNLGVTMEALAEQTGNNGYRSRALGLYAESARAWDVITRNPETMVRAGAADLSTPGVNLAYLNSRNTLNPVPGYEPQIYLHIDKDVFESSVWESLVPSEYRLSDETAFYGVNAPH